MPKRGGENIQQGNAGPIKIQRGALYQRHKHLQHALKHQNRGALAGFGHALGNPPRLERPIGGQPRKKFTGLAHAEQGIGQHRHPHARPKGPRRLAPTYASLGYYPGVYAVSEGKKDTYSVEGNNAELRHYLARLARRSRCFSRCPLALCHALRLVFFAFNSRQLYQAAQPQYPAHVFEFVAPRN